MYSSAIMILFNSGVFPLALGKLLDLGYFRLTGLSFRCPGLAVSVTHRSIPL